MSMTRAEAIDWFEQVRDIAKRNLGEKWTRGCEKHYQLKVDLAEAALTALRPVSREQVEKGWRGEWEWYDEEVGSPLEGIEREWGWRCSKCKVVLPDDFDDPDNPPAMRFCQWCGAPMTDEAVQMVMERMEELYEQ